MIKAGAIIDDRYLVESKLGEGGLATVYLVRHRRLGTPYALKLLRQDSPTIRRRLMREGELQANLRHPNIAAVVDVVDVMGAPGLVMEYVRGSSLDVMLWNERMTPLQIDHVAIGIMRGVAAAHSVGTIHRDLKPANILLDVIDGVLMPKVTDFGLAKALDGYSETAANVMMGTPQYMAPEQIEDAASVDRRADIWSLGAMLYEMVSGVMPFDEPDVRAVLEAVLDNRRRTIQEVAPQVPRRQQEAIERCLRADPAERPQSVDELLEMWGGVQLPAGAGGFASSLLERAMGRGGGVIVAGMEASAPSRPARAHNTPVIETWVPEVPTGTVPTVKLAVGLPGGLLLASAVGVAAVGGASALAFVVGRGEVVQPGAPAPVPGAMPPPARPASPRPARLTQRSPDP